MYNYNVISISINGFWNCLHPAEHTMHYALYSAAHSKMECLKLALNESFSKFEYELKPQKIDFYIVSLKSRIYTVQEKYVLFFFCHR